MTVAEKKPTNQWVLLAASLAYATAGSWYAMTRDDGKASAEQVSSLRERVRAVEVRADGLELRETMRRER